MNVVTASFTFAAWASTWPTPVALFLRFLPVPIYVAIGVWRSAPRHDGARLWAEAARAAVIPWTAFLAML